VETKLTADMLRALRDEAGAAGDNTMLGMCDIALGRDLDIRQGAREDCAAAITDARAMDDSTPFVRVVA
jgi:hypothetical protein